MENLNNFFNLSTDYFSLTSKKCKFNIESMIGVDGNAHNVLMAYPLPTEAQNFAFSGTHGLCLTTPHGALHKKNILATLISLPQNNVKKTLLFFEEYGFLLPLPNEGAEIDIVSLTETLNRIKATVLLMSALEAPQKNYEQILHLSLYLFMGKVVTIATANNMSYKTFQHPLHDILRNQVLTASMPIVNDDGYIYINDTLYHSQYKLNADEYEDIVNAETFTCNYPGINDYLYRQLTLAYQSCVTVQKNIRLMIEFLFHYMHSVGVIKEVTFANGIEYYGNPNHDNFNDNLKRASLIFARIILSGEINHNTRSIRPFYNPGTLEPSWKSPSLLAGLYFSIFYMKPGSEIYRKCSNPTCSNYFLVKTSNSRKKYCCDNCRNANNQRSHRLRNQK